MNLPAKSVVHVNPQIFIGADLADGSVVYDHWTMISFVLLTFKMRWLLSHQSTKFSTSGKYTDGLVSLCRRLRTAVSSENLKTKF